MSRLGLFLAGRVNSAAILRADVATLSIALRGVVTLEKTLHEIGVTASTRVKDDLNDFGVARASRTDLLIGRIRCDATLISNGRDVDAVQLKEFAFRTPKTTKTKVGRFGVFGKRRQHGDAQYQVRAGNDQPLGTSRQGVSGINYGGA